MDERLQKVLELLEQALDLLKQAAAIRTRFLERDLPKAVATGKVETVMQVVRNYMEQDQRLDKSLEDAVAAAREQAAALAAEPQVTGPRPITPLALAEHFRSVAESLQEAAEPKPGADSMALLRNLEIEVKGLIVIERDQPKIVTPEPGTAIDPGQLSVIRMAFGSVPLLRKPGAAPTQ